MATFATVLGSGGEPPSGTFDVTANGTYDVTDYDKLNINITRATLFAPTIEVSKAESDGHTMIWVIDAKNGIWVDMYELCIDGKPVADLSITSGFKHFDCTKFDCAKIDWLSYGEHTFTVIAMNASGFLADSPSSNEIILYGMAGGVWDF